MELDMNDPEIRQMVLNNHHPREEWARGTLHSVNCCTCGLAWPCPTIVAARSTAPPKRMTSSYVPDQYPET